MFKIGIFAQKGGAGKTTFAIHGSVQAAEQYRVFAGDADEQQSLFKWGQSRPFSTPAIERLSEMSIGSQLANVERNGYQVAVVDCPPHARDSIATIAKELDFAIVPCRPSRLDLDAVGAAVRILEANKVPFAFVLNAVRAQSRRKNADARAALESWGPVCPFMVPRLDAYEDALLDGRAVTEFAPGSVAADAIRNAWGWLFNYAMQYQKATA